MNPAAHARLLALRRACLAALHRCGEADAWQQLHPELSPLAWHVGHAFFMEAYWVCEVVCADSRTTAAWQRLFFPEYTPKPGRGARLPALESLQDITLQLAAASDAAWQDAAGGDHPLMRDEYLPWFIVQHYAQHRETIELVLRQRDMRSASVRSHNLTPQAPAFSYRHLPASEVRLGAIDTVCAYDNELPAHTAALAAFRIAERPVNNSEWLAFMTDGGYDRAELWDASGWRWLQASGARCPQHWRAQPDGSYDTPVRGETLRADAPVHGICWHEAQAFARWAGARLPHEHEWEYAAATGALPRTGKVWEWCSNPLHPYPGFRAFPYEGYSKPWFDGTHRVLRGGSRITEAELRRASFRNFYPESHRHVCAGLRLAQNA